MPSNVKHLSDRTVGAFLMLIPAIIILLITVPAVAIPKELPHYFPAGLAKTTDPPHKQFEYLWLYINATQQHLQSPRGQRTFSQAIKVEREIHGKKLIFIFDPWWQVGDKYYFYDFGGVRELSKKEWEIARDDFIEYITEAIDTAHDYHKGIPDMAMEIKAKESNISVLELRQKLNKKVPGAPSVTFGEMQQVLQDLKKSDFVPKEIHLGYGRWWGAVWLNSGIGYVTPQGRISDYLRGKPLIAIHELCHANPKLQNYPIANYVDVELMASVPEAFLPEDKISVLYHSYLREVRGWIKTFFGLDLDRAKDEIILFDHDANLRIDPERFDFYAEKLEKIKSELSDFFRKKALPEYYKDPIFAMTINENLRDDIGIFRILMALNYDLTGLGGHGPTMSWLKVEHPKIMNAAYRAYEKSRKAAWDKDKNQSRNQPSLMVLKIFQESFRLSDEKLLELANKYSIDPRDLEKKSLPELIKLFGWIYEQEKIQTLTQEKEGQ